MSNVRYKELKYNGRIYTKKYEIDEILIKNNFSWFLDAEVENVRIEIMKNTLILNAGIWYNGVWEYGVIRDVDWRSGVFKNGVIYNGVFKKITVEKGIIFNGLFLKGDVLFADIRGGEFKDVKIHSTTNNEHENKTPSEKANTYPKISGEINGQIGQKIQKDVKENYSSISNRTMQKNIVDFYRFVLNEKNENKNDDGVMLDDNNNIIKNEMNKYVINKTQLEKIFKKYFHQQIDIEIGSNNDELKIWYKELPLTSNDNILKKSNILSDILTYLEDLDGVISVHHKRGEYFELTFDKDIEIV